MRVVQILPGSGGTFYCENCLRDTALVQALRRRGQDVILVPMYLPLYTDGPDIARDVPVFFGGVNVYLQQQFGLFRRTPRWLDRVLDARWVLGLAARQEGSTTADGMGAMTLSMLRGEDGNQAKELERLVTWLAEAEQPDVVHISTSMLLGLARRIKEVLKVPVVCSMQDEDTWIDKVEGDYAAACWDAIRERAADCDRFVTVSHFYRDAMCSRLGLSADSVDVVPIGIDLDGYVQAKHDGVPTIGFLSKLTPSLGLETLVEAFILLKRKDGLEDLQLRAMGGLTGGDKRSVARLQRKLVRAGMGGAAEFLTELDRPARIKFLKDLSVLSVPMPEGEAFGSFIVEAWAAGVPVVQPRAGAFPELVEQTGGGVIYDGKSPEALAAALEPLLRDRELARELGQRGREAAVESFSVETMAERMVGVYEEVKRKAERLKG
jgi:glycosyltransferase involved in cell wall biosynthesis